MLIHIYCFDVLLKFTFSQKDFIIDVSWGPKNDINVKQKRFLLLLEGWNGQRRIIRSWISFSKTPWLGKINFTWYTKKKNIYCKQMSTNFFYQLLTSLLVSSLLNLFNKKKCRINNLNFLLPVTFKLFILKDPKCILNLILLVVIAQQYLMWDVVRENYSGICYENYGFKDGLVYCKYSAYFVTFKFCSEVCYGCTLLSMPWIKARF